MFSATKSFVVFVFGEMAEKVIKCICAQGDVER